eukprot:symbB.v1.2.015095.t1/scaffold1106.1/size137404/7
MLDAPGKRVLFDSLLKALRNDVAEESFDAHLAVQNLPQTSDEVSELEEIAADLSDDAKKVRDLAKEIGRAIQQERTGESAFQIFEQIRDLANNVAKPEACAEWTFACGRIIAATRKVEELLKPLVDTGVLSGHGKEAAIFDPAQADDDSELLTHPTAPSAPQPAFSASMTTDTRAHLEEETSRLPESVASGEDLKELQELEEELLVLRVKHSQKNHSDLAKILQRLGELKIEAGDFNGARQHLEEALRIEHALHGDRNHPGVSATLHELGNLSQQTGDLEKAKQYLEESLRIKRAVHADKDHPGVGATLYALGQLSQKTGDLEKAMQYLEESLRINRALHGDKDHPDFGVTLHALGQLSQQTGDLEKAKQYLEESFRMKHALHGDRNHPEVGATLHALGQLSQKTGDLEKAKQYLEVSLRMSCALHGDRDHCDVAAMLLALGQLSLQAVELEKAQQYLEELWE